MRTPESSESPDQIHLGEDIFRLMVESAADGMCVVDAKGNILFCNQRTLELLGRTVDETNGHSLTEFLEEKRASGAAPRLAAKVLSQILQNELHDQLHWLTVSPARYEYYRNLWNRFCEAHGAPEEKIADPASGPAKSTEEGPF